jgi:D-alanyl-D-alanine carboxypeptidase
MLLVEKIKMRKISAILIFLMIFCANLHFFDIKNQVFAAATDEIKVSAESMITIESSTGRVLYHKDEHKRLPMASTTKIITAIVAIEHTKDLDIKHEITKPMTGVEGSSIYLKFGEKIFIH